MLAQELLGWDAHCDGRLKLSLGKEHLLERWLLVEVGKQPEGGASVLL